MANFIKTDPMAKADDSQRLPLLWEKCEENYMTVKGKANL